MEQKEKKTAFIGLRISTGLLEKIDSERGGKESRSKAIIRTLEKGLESKNGGNDE